LVVLFPAVSCAAQSSILFVRELAFVSLHCVPATPRSHVSHDKKSFVAGMKTWLSLGFGSDFQVIWRLSSWPMNCTYVQG
jgi:hypothetical protein